MSGLCDAYLAELRGEFPKLRLIEKADDRLSQLIDVGLRIVTAGGQSAYQSRYVTTLGQRIYLPAGWAQRSDAERYIVLRHEAVHLRQFRRYTLVGMAALYLLPVLPLGLAWGRARIEWEAYVETLRATAEVHGLKAARSPQLHRHIVLQFTSAAYGWMWPFPKQVQGWIDEELSRLEAELG